MRSVSLKRCIALKPRHTSADPHLPNPRPEPEEQAGARLECFVSTQSCDFSAGPRSRFLRPAAARPVYGGDCDSLWQGQKKQPVWTDCGGFALVSSAITAGGKRSCALPGPLGLRLHPGFRLQWPGTARSNRAAVAQWIEHLTSDQVVGGSNPSGRANVLRRSPRAAVLVPRSIHNYAALRKSFGVDPARDRGVGKW